MIVNLRRYPADVREALAAARRRLESTDRTPLAGYLETMIAELCAVVRPRSYAEDALLDAKLLYLAGEYDFAAVAVRCAAFLHVEEV